MHFLIRILLFIILYSAQTNLCAQSIYGQTQSAENTAKALRQLGVPFYEGNEVHILATGVGKFNDMFSAIRKAKRFVHMDYFKFQNDSICSELFHLLTKKVEQGVEVRIVYDSFGNQNSKNPIQKELLDSLRILGIQIYGFDRMKFPWINHLLHRNHHKITVIDGEVAYSGGMNVADYYLHGKPGIGEWRDMHIKVFGPAVEGYEQIFEEMWYATTEERLAHQEYLGVNLSKKNQLLALANRVPRETPSIMRDTYIAAIDNAQEIIQIVNPYTSLVNSVRKSLYRALDRGVRLQIMASFNSDMQMNSDVVAQEMYKLMKRGAEVYYYRNGFHHSKYMICDDVYCTVGTTNLDARSLRYDYEVNAFVFDESVALELRKVFDKDVEERCTRVTPETFKSYFTLKRRFAGRFFGIFKKLL